MHQTSLSSASQTEHALLNDIGNKLRLQNHVNDDVSHSFQHQPRPKLPPTPLLFTMKNNRLRDHRYYQSIAQIQSKRTSLKTLRKLRNYLHGIRSTYNSRKSQEQRLETI